MTAFKTLDMGIKSIQAGQPDEGRRLIRIAIKTGELPSELCAVGFCWLAEVEADLSAKREYYQKALEADPANSVAQQRLSSLLTAQLTAQQPPAPQSPPPSYTTPASTPTQPPAVQYGSGPGEHLVGIIGGANGSGSGFFVSPEGLIATTRFLVGGVERVMVEFQPGQQVAGVVVRSFLDYDLALIKVDFAPRTTLPITPQQIIADETPLVMMPYNRQPITGTQRPTKRALPTQWIPTTFSQDYYDEGAPVFDSYNYLVGMTTCNSARNSTHCFILHIHVLRARMEQYFAELRAEPRTYCPTCGSGSRAGGVQLFYCENCGATLPQAALRSRYPVAQAEYYYGSSGITCRHCGSQVGYHAGRCLCCGRTPDGKVS